MGGFNIYNQIKKNRNQIHKQILQIKKQLSQLPDGKLICSGNSWYQSDGHNKTYIKKKDRILAEKLATKKYLTMLLEDLEKEQSALDMYLRHCSKGFEKVNSLFSGSSEFLTLLSPHFSPVSKELEDWMNTPYIKNQKYLEYLTHKVGPDEFVRSKSEAMIVKVLKENKIPYRYECQLLLDDIELYPDFTIRHPETGKLFYWEHFGWLDKAEYVKNMHSKLQLYTSNNILPGINLITTYENQENPLTFKAIEFQIQQHFL